MLNIGKETIIMFNNIICFILNFLINRANLASELKDGFKLVPSAEAVAELEEVHQTTAERLDAHAKSLDEQLGALIIHADGITNNEDNLNKVEERIEKSQSKLQGRINSLNYLLSSTAQRMNEIGEIQGELADRIDELGLGVADLENINSSYSIEGKLKFANIIQQLDRRIERLEELENINIRRHYTDYTKELNR